MSSDESDILDPSNARERVLKLMNEIYAKKEKLKTEADIEKMANDCTKMLMGMHESRKKPKGKEVTKEIAKGVTKGKDAVEGFSGMSLKEYGAKKAAGRPDFGALYKGRVEEILKHKGGGDKWTKASASDDSLSSSESESGSEDSEEERPTEVFGDATKPRRDLEGMRKKAEDWLKKYRGNIGYNSSSEDDSPKNPPKKSGQRVGFSARDVPEKEYKPSASRKSPSAGKTALKQIKK